MDLAAHRENLGIGTHLRKDKGEKEKVLEEKMTTNNQRVISLLQNT